MNKKEIKNLWNTNHEGKHKLKEFDISGDHIHFEFSHFKFKNDKEWYNVIINRITRKVLGYVGCEWKDEDGFPWSGMLDKKVPEKLIREVENFFYINVVPNYTGIEPLWVERDFTAIENGIGA